jgi:hypothetical protein
MKLEAGRVDVVRARFMAGIREARLGARGLERETGFEPATFCLGSRHSAS